MGPFRCRSFQFAEVLSLKTISAGNQAAEQAQASQVLKVGASRLQAPATGGSWGSMAGSLTSTSWRVLQTVFILPSLTAMRTTTRTSAGHSLLNVIYALFEHTFWCTSASCPSQALVADAGDFSTYQAGASYLTHLYTCR